MGASDVRERAVADSQFGSGTPATWYLGLSTTVPNGDGTNFTEPAIGAYARVAMTNNVTNFPAATTSGGITTKTNGTAPTFANPTGYWGTVLYWGFFLAVSGGTPDWTNPLDNPVTVASGNTPVQFPIGGLVLPFKG